MPSILRILYVFEIPLFSQIVFAYEKRYCILISFCLLSTTCIQQRQKLETKECSTTQADTSFIVVDSTLLLYLKRILPIKKFMPYWKNDLNIRVA